MFNELNKTIIHPQIKCYQIMERQTLKNNFDNLIEEVFENVVF
jgi:hypothetical protein